METEGAISQQLAVFESGALTQKELTRVVSGSNPEAMIAELVGLHLQLKALDMDASKRFEKDRSALIERRTYIQRASKYLSSGEVKNVSEQRWIQFLEAASMRGEVVATEDLAHRQGHTF